MLFASSISQGESGIMSAFWGSGVCCPKSRRRYGLGSTTPRTWDTRTSVRRPALSHSSLWRIVPSPSCVTTCFMLRVIPPTHCPSPPVREGVRGDSTAGAKMEQPCPHDDVVDDAIPSESHAAASQHCEPSRQHCSRHRRSRQPSFHCRRGCRRLACLPMPSTQRHNTPPSAFQDPFSSAWRPQKRSKRRSESSPACLAR
jgi:hypothetical protein